MRGLLVSVFCLLSSSVALPDCIRHEKSCQINSGPFCCGYPLFDCISEGTDTTCEDIRDYPELEAELFLRIRALKDSGRLNSTSIGQMRSQMNRALGVDVSRNQGGGSGGSGGRQQGSGGSQQGGTARQQGNGPARQQAATPGRQQGSPARQQGSPARQQGSPARQQGSSPTRQLGPTRQPTQRNEAEVRQQGDRFRQMLRGGGGT